MPAYIFCHHEDIDECTEDSHDCSSVETCVNHLGHYTCQHRSVDGDSLNSTAYNKENNDNVSDYEVVLAKVEKLEF